VPQWSYQARTGPEGAACSVAPGRPVATTLEGTGAGPTNSAVRRVVSVSTATMLRLAGAERDDASQVSASAVQTVRMATVVALSQFERNIRGRCLRGIGEPPCTSTAGNGFGY
jgi:hypothetical protein